MVREETGEIALDETQSRKLYDSEFVEVKAGSGPIDVEQLDDYLRMAGEKVVDSQGHKHTVRKVRYVLLDPDGGKANLALLVEKIQDNADFSIELFNHNHQRRVLTQSNLVDMASIERWLGT